MLLHQLAHSRTGDKGNLVTISLIVFRKEDFPVSEEKVTAERVAAPPAARARVAAALPAPARARAGRADGADGAGVDAERAAA